MAGSRVAIVTGASRGIGAAVAERLAGDGMSIAVNFAGRPQDAEGVVERIRQRGGHALAVQGDVSDPVAVRRLFERTEAEFGGVDVLVNNAGIMQLATLADAADDSFERMVQINLKGVFNGMREASRRVRPGGRIINFSSSVVGQYQPTYGVYAATKAGVEAMSKVMANEMRGREITVNVVAPGPTATDLFLNGKSDELVERIRKLAPLERLGRPDDIASVVAFLAGPDGSWVNGQILRVNGGLV